MRSSAMVDAREMPRNSNGPGPTDRGKNLQNVKGLTIYKLYTKLVRGYEKKRKKRRKRIRPFGKI